MNPFSDPYEEVMRHQAEQRAQVAQDRLRFQRRHSRAGLMRLYLKVLTDRIDPSGRARRELR